MSIENAGAAHTGAAQASLYNSASDGDQYQMLQRKFPQNPHGKQSWTT